MAMTLLDALWLWADDTMNRANQSKRYYRHLERYYPHFERYYQHVFVDSTARFAKNAHFYFFAKFFENCGFPLLYSCKVVIIAIHMIDCTLCKNSRFCVIICGNPCLSKQHKINISLLLYRNHEYAFLREGVVCLFLSVASMPIGTVPEEQKSKKINWLIGAAASPPPFVFTHCFSPTAFSPRRLSTALHTPLFDGSICSASVVRGGGAKQQHHANSHSHFHYYLHSHFHSHFHSHWHYHSHLH